MTEELSTTETAEPVLESIVAEELEEEISYHAVEKDGHVTAIWEMKGRKHLRTIDPRSHEGKAILGTHEIDEPAAIAEASGA
ncbi:MAG: hypothetical protein IT175_00435 [Acidobacteria bacterium]|nr:hypothetical protein [Acidobacteriota bacterium]